MSLAPPFKIPIEIEEEPVRYRHCVEQHAALLAYLESDVVFPYTQLKEQLNIMQQQNLLNAKCIQEIKLCLMGNGHSGIKMHVDRNTRSVRVLMWSIGVIYTALVGGTVALIFNGGA